MAKKIDVNGLDHYHDKVSAMVADEYSSSATYAVGDYCFHAGTLYKCTTAITTAENWTSGHWTAAKLAEDTSELKNALNDLSVSSISTYKETYGMINAQKKWGSISNNYRHIIIPIKSGDSIDVLGNADDYTYIAFLKSYTTPVNGATADLSTATGFNDRIYVGKNASLSYTTPSDANFLFYLVYYSGNVTPQSLKINGYDITKNLANTIVGIENELQTDKFILFDKIAFTQTWESGTFTTRDGSASTNQTETARQRMVQYGKNGIKAILHTDGTFTTNLVLYTDGLLVESKTGYSKSDKVIPANKYFRILLADGTDNTVDISGYTDAQIKTHVSIENSQFYDLINPTVNWCVMGDSIAAGYVSYLDGDTPTYKVDNDLSWAYRVAKKNNWNLTNIAIGGTGWNKATNAEISQGVDTTSAHYVAEHTDFTPFNLVTLSYGINDWKANYNTGTIDGDYTTPTTTIGGMRATIDAIIESNPHCKIIVILPLNCAGYDFNYGSESTNWALGYTLSNSGTLEQFVTALISVCDYYGIQYIDMAHYSCVNRNNLLGCLTDGVHPNAETHEILSRELARKITFA